MVYGDYSAEVANIIKKGISELQDQLAKGTILHSLPRQGLFNPVQASLTPCFFQALSPICNLRYISAHH